MEGSLTNYRNIRTVLITLLDDRENLKFEVSLLIFKNVLKIDLTKNRTSDEWIEEFKDSDNIGQDTFTITMDNTTPFSTYNKILRNYYDSLSTFPNEFKAELKGNANINNKRKLLKLFDIHYYSKYTSLSKSGIMNKLNQILKEDPIYGGLKVYTTKTFNDDFQILERISESLNYSQS